MCRLDTHYKNETAIQDISTFIQDFINEDAIVVCIGTNRNISDSLAPLVGTLLQQQGFQLPVYGTLTEPIHAMNIRSELEHIKRKHPSSNVIAIDACLSGESKNIGTIRVKDSPLSPGLGVGKSLPKIGEVAILGIVDTEDTLFFNHLSNLDKVTPDWITDDRQKRLSFVMDMARTISNSVVHAVNIRLEEISKEVV